MFLHVHHFVVHASNIDKIINPNPSSLRYQIIKNSLDIGKLDLKYVRKLRNHLEHFDERLDKWVTEYYGAPFFDRNLVEGTLGFPDAAFLRALDGNTFKFQGESYDLEIIIEEVRRIEQLLKPRFKKTTRDKS
jgi:hypothetical protein